MGRLTLNVSADLSPREMEVAGFIACGRGEISGYNVSLDRMEIYQKTTEKTVNILFPVKNNKRWGLGISAGYALTPKGFQPYVGVGIQYNIIYF